VTKKRKKNWMKRSVWHSEQFSVQFSRRSSCGGFVRQVKPAMEVRRSILVSRKEKVTVCGNTWEFFLSFHEIDPLYVHRPFCPSVL